jgi:phosphonate transport system ATP-binding protein
MTILSIQNLHKSYVAGKPVLTGINLDIANDGFTAIIGPSGTGKSTLLRCINRLVEPSSGRIVFEGNDVVPLKGAGLRGLRRQIGMVFQEYNLVERLTVMENVLSGRLGYVSAWAAWLRKYPVEDVAYAFELLNAVGLGAFAQQRADALSGGQRQRVGIARALMQRPKLLLADEPTSSLDPRTSVEVLDILSRLAQSQNVPVMVNMHDVNLAKRFATRIVGMTGGKVVYDGNAEELTEDILKHIYGGESWLA